MEGGGSKEEATAGRDRDIERGRTSLSRSLSITLSLESVRQARIRRSRSLTRMSSTDSGSHSVEVVLSDSAARSEDSGDRIVRNETVASNRSSWRRGSISLSRDVGERIRDSISLSRDIVEQILGEIDDSMIARAGDSGDRVVGEEGGDENERLRISVDHVEAVKNGCIKLPDDPLTLSNGIRSRNVSFRSPADPVAKEIASPLPTDAILESTEKNQIQITRTSSLKDEEKLPRTLDYISYLLHLAVFGILGVLTRYLLQKLFGPGLLALTGDSTPLYLDLPSNILGSFLMGWFGIVFKADVRHVSDHLAVGLTTGYMGCLTTFSGWNQKMLDLASKGHWVFAVAGIILGMFIVNESITIGVESAEGLRRFLLNMLHKYSRRACCSFQGWRVDNRRRHLAVMIVMLLVWGSLCGLSGTLARTKLDDVTQGAILWLGCLVAPPGAWTRWYLSRLNGQGVGRKQRLKWLPIGTLSANVLAACLMAALSTINKAVNTKKCGLIVSGIQFGFLGSLSTVSTFVAEIFAMRQSNHPGRAFVYAAMTILLSFALGTLIYSVPVWTKHYN